MKDREQRLLPFPSEEETDKAWRRFQERVQNEPVPAVWSKLEEGLQENRRTQEAKLPLQVHFHREEPITVNKEAGINTQPMNKLQSPDPTTRARWRKLKAMGSIAAAVALVTVMLSTPWGDKAMASMLQTFRIQHMQTVDLSDNDWEKLGQSLSKGSPDGQTFKLDQFGTIRQEGGGKSKNATLADAEKSLGFKPLGAEIAQKISLEPETTLYFKMNVDEVNHMIRRLGGTVLLPEAANGQEIRFHVPAGATMELPIGKDGQTASLYETVTPTLDMAQGIDMDAVRQAVLNLPVLPDQLRNKLKSISDWKNTLPVPSMNGQSHNTELLGHEAVVSITGNSRSVVWIDKGHIYMLAGNASVFPGEEDLIRAAKELLQK